MTEPIRIQCEGSGHVGHWRDDWHQICKMCGGILRVNTGVVPRHDRDDILAMIERGDFG